MLPDERHVVVVEDDPGMRRAIDRLLHATGFHTASFPSPEAFLAETGGSPACVVLDIRLPGLSGFDLYEWLARDGIKPPVIFITAHDEPVDRERAKKAKAAAYLAKPFLGRDLISAVAVALGCTIPKAVPHLHSTEGNPPSDTPQ
jgi:FixJ family two-component response regulator